jgi:hypothetical protein
MSEPAHRNTTRNLRPVGYIRSREVNTVGLEIYGPEPAPDLHMQFEELLVTVWRAEANWRFDDFLDVATKQRRTERPRGVLRGDHHE